MNQQLRYVPRLTLEPEYVQVAITTACEEILKLHDNCWVLATIQEDGYYVLVIENGMPATLPRAVYSVMPQAGAGRAEIKQVFGESDGKKRG